MGKIYNNIKSGIYFGFNIKSDDYLGGFIITS